MGESPILKFVGGLQLRQCQFGFASLLYEPG
jgi:hypothetical protein